MLTVNLGVPCLLHTFCLQSALPQLQLRIWHFLGWGWGGDSVFNCFSRHISRLLCHRCVITCSSWWKSGVPCWHCGGADCADHGAGVWGAELRSGHHENQWQSAGLLRLEKTGPRCPFLTSAINLVWPPRPLCEICWLLAGCSLSWIHLLPPPPRTPTPPPFFSFSPWGAVTIIILIILLLFCYLSVHSTSCWSLSYWKVDVGSLTCANM